MKIFQKLLSIIFGEPTDNKSSSDINPHEKIARYIFQKKGRYNEDKMQVKYAAFMPAPNGQSSVYRTSDLAEKDIWHIGTEYVEKKRTDSQKLKARADLKAFSILDQDLQLNPDTRPHKLHANIEGWPEEKDKKKLVAIELALASTLEIKPE